MKDFVQNGTYVVCGSPSLTRAKIPLKKSEGTERDGILVGFLVPDRGPHTVLYLRLWVRLRHPAGLDTIH
jgi:hypothetical protein